MRTIINSFFRNIGRILAYLVFIIIIYLLILWLGVDPKNLFYDDGYALGSSQGWYFPEDFHYQGVFSQTSLNNSTSTEFVPSYISDVDGNKHMTFYLPVDSLGRYISIYHPVMNNNFAYMITYYFCTVSGDMPTIDKVYFGSNLTNVQDDLAYQLTRRKLSPKPLSNTNPSFSSCFVHTVKTEVSGGGRNVTTLHLSSASPGGLYFMGFEFFPLGNSTSSFSNVVSQVASVSSSITSMQSNINSNITTSQNTIISNQNSNTQVQIQNANSNQQQTNEGLSNINSNITETNDLIKNDDIDNNHATSYFTDFSQNTYGIQDIINVPLHYIQRLTTETCQPLNFTLPFVHTNVSLPCMTTIYRTYFNDWFSVYQTLMLGIVCYGVGIKIMREVRDALNPMSTGRVELIKL